ncbi:response regulator transcription factor [Acetivibrio ethanolgignens]|uniref:Stage 0 sporulation protein A homolog n=1 Tax=Acetivibrio ethanolgignens TaxID=290052 RepID=A0A0V8QIS7_9FIRM|nr:response regulator transcription factor [Acetivibrio ethanolgignens]KSV60382.1 ArsR family transcriptional regulator [Acetivibrio ethanolgignens]
MAKILVIEDDENIQELIRIALSSYGYEVKTFEKAEEGLSQMEKERPSLCVCDLMLPGMDGLSAIKKVREKPEFKELPIMILAAKDTKPFGIMELAARIRSLLRRFPEKTEENEFSAGDFHVDFAKREVVKNGHRIELTYKEYELLHYLIVNQDRVVEREELLNNIWGYTQEIETRTLDIHIRTLRQKIGDKKGKYIRTVRGVGYRFVKEEEKR